MEYFVLEYSAHGVFGDRLRTDALPFLRKAMMIILAVALLAGVGYLIWHFS